jgi:hypothetical protein
MGDDSIFITIVLKKDATGMGPLGFYVPTLFEGIECYLILTP